MIKLSKSNSLQFTRMYQLATHLNTRRCMVSNSIPYHILPNLTQMQLDPRSCDQDRRTSNSFSFTQLLVLWLLQLNLVNRSEIAALLRFLLT